jgi:hypothetical protein
MVKIWPASARAKHVLPDRYHELRQAQCEVHSALFKYVSTKALKVSARRLGLQFEGKELILGAESELTVLFDYAIYDYREPLHRRDAKNAIDRRLSISPPDAGGDEMVVLQAAKAARYRLLVVEDVERGVGVAVKDIFRDEHFFLFDVGFSRTASPGQGLAARVVEPEGIPMTTGAALPVDNRVLVDVAEAVVHEFIGRFTGGVDALSVQDRAKLSSIVIRSCFAHDTSSDIVYQ